MGPLSRRARSLAFPLCVIAMMAAGPIAFAQPPAPAMPTNAQVLARVHAERLSAEQALANAADDKAFAQAADRLRQAASFEAAAATAGLTPDAAARILADLSQQARARQNAVEKTATDYLKNRLATAASDPERSAAYRSYDSSIAQLRIAREIADEALRRLRPVAQTTGMAGDVHHEAYSATQGRMEQLLVDIANTHVEQPRLPGYTNPDGSRASAQDREIEEHLRQQKRDADIQEYLRLADGGVFVDPKTGQALSQEMRDRVAKNAKLALVDVLKTSGIETGLMRTLLGWTDSRTDIARQIEESVRSNSWYQALDMLNPSVSGASPQMVALAMANVLRLSADQIYAWRSGQLPEGGNGGLTGWMYENFWAKKNVGLGTALRVGDLEKGGAIDRDIEAYTKEVDAAVKALNEMAATPEPKDLSPDSHRLLETLGFIAKADGKETYRAPSNGDTGARLQRNLNLPGATLLDLISAGNAYKVVLMAATPQLIAARVGLIGEGLELGAGAIRTGEFLTTALVNAGMDAGFQKWETGSVQWDRLVLDTIVVNVGLGVAAEATGVVAKAVVGRVMTKEAQELAKTFAKNRASRDMAEHVLSQTLGLFGDSALLTYWQGKFQSTGMSYDDFVANLLNGVIGRVAPVVGNKATQTLGAGAQRAGLAMPRTLREFIFGLSPSLRDAFARGLTPELLNRLIEDGRFAEAEHARKEASDRLSSALGADYLKMNLNDPRLVDRLTEALETGQLGFADLKAVLGDTPALNALVDGVNAYRLKGFDEVITKARELARADIEAEFLARMQRFKDNLGADSEMFKKAEADTKVWRDGELKKVDEKIDAPGSKNNTSDVDRSITSTYLRNSLKVATDEWFTRNRDGRAATSARAYDVNEYYHVIKLIDFIKQSKLDLRSASHTLPNGTTVTHADLMEAMGLATAMMEMSPAQREQFRKNRGGMGDAQRMERLFTIAEDSLSHADQELKAEVARLATSGFDPNNPDTITRARDNLYGTRAIELGNKEATLRRLIAEKSPYATKLAAEIEAEWAMAKREGIEAYTNFAGLEIIVSKAQMAGVTAREMIEGKVDTEALEAANAKRRKENTPERTATAQQALIDGALADFRNSYSREQLTGALDDQIRFIAHHVSAFFEGHESATQVASALSKYAERSVLFMKLLGTDTTTDGGKELSDLSKALVKNRGDLKELKKLITVYGGGDENTGIRKFVALLEGTVPGLKGLFDPNIFLGTPANAANTGTAGGATGTNSAALNAIRHEQHLEREQLRQTNGSQAVVQSVQQHKSDLEQELAQLQQQKADDQRMAAGYNRADWKLARELEADQAGLAQQLSLIPWTKAATPTFMGLASQLNAIDSRLKQLRSARTAAGAGPIGAEIWRDKLIASLQQQIKDDEAARAHYDVEAKKETADAAARVAGGQTNFNPIGGLQRVSAATKSTTTELDKVGKALAGSDNAATTAGATVNTQTNTAGGAPIGSTLGLSPGSQPITSPTTIAGSREEQMREQLSNSAVYDSKYKDHQEITDYRTLKFFRNPDGSMTLQAPNRTYRAHFDANGLHIEDLGPTPANTAVGAASAAPAAGKPPEPKRVAAGAAEQKKMLDAMNQAILAKGGNPDNYHATWESDGSGVYAYDRVNDSSSSVSVTWTGTGVALQDHLKVAAGNAGNSSTGASNTPTNTAGGAAAGGTFTLAGTSGDEFNYGSDADEYVSTKIDDLLDARGENKDDYGPARKAADGSFSRTSKDGKTKVVGRARNGRITLQRFVLKTVAAAPAAANSAGGPAAVPAANKPAELKDALIKAGADPGKVTVNDTGTIVTGTSKDGTTTFTALRKGDGSFTVAKRVAAGAREQQQMLAAMNQAILAKGGNPDNYHVTWERDGSGVSAYDRVNDSSSSVSVTWTGTGVAVEDRLKGANTAGGAAGGGSSIGGGAKAPVPGPPPGAAPEAPCAEAGEACAGDEAAYNDAVDAYKNAKSELDAAVAKASKTAADLSAAGAAMDAAQKAGGVQLAAATARVQTAKTADAEAVAAQTAAGEKLAAAEQSARNAKAALDACEAKAAEKCQPKAGTPPQPQPGANAVGGGAAATKPGANTAGGGETPAPGGGNTMPGGPPGPAVVGKTAAAPSAPACKKADSDCDALRQFARERQAAADTAARALPFAQNDLAAADAADRNAIQDHDLALQTYATAAGLSTTSQKDQVEGYKTRAREADDKGNAESANAKRLRAEAADIKAAAEKTAAEAAAAWSAYTACLNLPPCPDDTTSAPPAAVNMMPGAPTGGLGEDTGSVCGTGDCVPVSKCVGDCINMAQGCEADGTCQQQANLDLIHQLMVSAASAAMDAFSARDDSGPRSMPGALRAIPRALAALVRGGGRFASRSRPIDLAPGTFVTIESPQKKSDARTATPSVTLVSTGSSTGDAFRLRVTDPAGKTRKISMPEGLVLQPIKQAGNAPPAPPAAAQSAGASRATAIGAFCLEFAKLPPVAGMLYQVAPQALQQKFKSLQSVLQAATRLQQMGGLHPDSNPKTYADSIKQYALWTRIGHWDAKTFEASFVELTKKNVAALKQNWTQAMETTIKGAAPGRWRDVQAVLQQADALAAVSPKEIR